MLYNLRILRRRYRNKTRSQMLEIVKRNQLSIDSIVYPGYYNVRRDILTMNDNVKKLQYFGKDYKVVISINRTT